MHDPDLAAPRECFRCNGSGLYEVQTVELSLDLPGWLELQPASFIGLKIESYHQHKWRECGVVVAKRERTPALVSKGYMPRLPAIYVLIAEIDEGLMWVNRRHIRVSALVTQEKEEK